MQGRRRELFFTEKDLQASFHGKIDSQQAEELLKDKATGTFLFRNGDANNLYIISAVTRLPYSDTRSIKHSELVHKSLSLVEGYYFTEEPSLLRETLIQLLAEFDETYLFPLPCTTQLASPLGYALNEDALLSAEILLKILTFADPKTLCTVSLTCKMLYSLAKEDEVWERLYREDFGCYVPQSFLARGDLSWKIKYIFEYSLLKPDEPAVLGIRSQAMMTLLPYGLSNFVYYSLTKNDTLVVSYFDSLQPVNRPIYRVTFPAVGYTFDQRPDLDEIFPTLKGVLSNYPATKERKLTHHGNYLNYQRAMVHPKYRGHLQLGLEYSQSTKFLLNAALKPNRLIRVLTLLDPEEFMQGRGLEEMVGFLADMISTDLPPLQKLRLLPYRSFCIQQFPQWLGKRTCPLQTIVLEMAQGDPSFVLSRFLMLLQSNRTVKKVKCRIMQADIEDFDISSLIFALGNELAHVSKVVLSIVDARTDYLAKIEHTLPNLCVRRSKKGLSYLQAKQT